MGNTAQDVAEYDAIAQVVEHYLAAAKKGQGNDMRPAFHQEATIFGYAGEELFAGPIEQLFAWTDHMGPANDIRPRISSIDLAGTVATVRIEIDNWNGLRFTDLFTLLKVDSEWMIMNKVFHLHTPNENAA